MLVFIGRNWLNQIDARGRRRLEDPADHVRIEIETALGFPDALVIPMLVDRAMMPDADELPESLRSLCRRNGFSVRPAGADDNLRPLRRAVFVSRSA